MLFGIWDWIRARVILMAAAAVGVLAAIASIKRSARKQAEIDRLEEVLKNVRTKNVVTQKVDRLPDGDAARRLRDKWSRD